MKRSLRIADTVATFATLLYIVVPVLVVVVFAFQETPRISLPFDGPSLHWFEQVLGDERFRSALVASLEIAVLAALISTVIGLSAALATSRTAFRGRNVIRVLAFAPVVVPPVFIGFSLLIAIGDIGGNLSLFTVLLAHVLIVAPISWAVLDASLDRFDFDVEDAARDLYASPAQTLRYVTLPLLSRPLLGSALLTFAFSIEEFVVTNFVVGSTPTLPIVVWGNMRRNVDPSINAIATIILALLITAGLLAWLLLRRSSSDREVAEA